MDKEERGAIQHLFNRASLVLGVGKNTILAKLASENPPSAAQMIGRLSFVVAGRRRGERSRIESRLNLAHDKCRRDLRLRCRRQALREEKGNGLESPGNKDGKLRGTRENSEKFEISSKLIKVCFKF